jgi:DNA-binding response OmpR family regulator
MNKQEVSQEELKTYIDAAITFYERVTGKTPSSFNIHVLLANCGIKENISRIHFIAQDILKNREPTTDKLRSDDRSSIHHEQEGDTMNEDMNHSIITVGPIKLDTLHREVSVNGTSRRLTPVESKILHVLAAHANQICTFNQIGSSVFAGNDELGNSILIKSHIRHLRQKIEPHPNQPMYILTIPDVGYMLVSHETEPSYPNVEDA